VPPNTKRARLPGVKHVSDSLETRAQQRVVGVLDLGTTNIKAALMDATGTFNGLASTACPDEVPNRDLFAFDPALVFSQVCEMLRAYRGADLGALVLTNQRATIIGVDRSGAVLCCLAWSDSRCQELLEAATGALSPVRFRQLTGLHRSHLYAIGKILWLKTHHPEVFARVDTFVFLQDYVLHRLTGAGYVCDYSNASVSGLYNIRKRTWEPELLAAVGLTIERLPRIREAGTVIGTLLPDVATLTGLAADTPVILAGGDQQCGAYGLGGEDHVGVMSLGTSGSLSVVSDDSAIDHNGGSLCFAYIDPARIVIEAFMNSFSSSLDWASQLTGIDFTAKDFSLDVAALNEEACYLPFIHGIGTPDYCAAAGGALVGLRMDTGRHGIAQAVIKGLALETRRLVDECRRATRMERLILAGGAAGNPAIAGLLQAALDVDVFVNVQKEATLFGAGLIAWRSLGTGGDVRKIIAGRITRVEPKWIPGISRETVSAWSARYGRWVEAAKG